MTNKAEILQEFEIVITGSFKATGTYEAHTPEEALHIAKEALHFVDHDSDLTFSFHDVLSEITEDAF